MNNLSIKSMLIVLKVRIPLIYVLLEKVVRYVRRKVNNFSRFRKKGLSCKLIKPQHSISIKIGINYFCQTNAFHLKETFQIFIVPSHA